ncbi:hypothetical protein EVAR_9_1 [Eumeta japonica]|uniref:Uncharacterized protein n=1 Tax=Eumeta variegata TaxID=151549 RepID=A0A4C1SB50_EUMVA|nr:hypothetical protein EVAR_9_1 [Eumeta japonica]
MSTAASVPFAFDYVRIEQNGTGSWSRPVTMRAVKRFACNYEGRTGQPEQSMDTSDLGPTAKSLGTPLTAINPLKRNRPLISQQHLSCCNESVVDVASLV